MKKAGNLRYAFARTSGEAVVIFDADFCPRSVAYSYEQNEKRQIVSICLSVCVSLSVCVLLVVDEDTLFEELFKIRSTAKRLLPDVK